MFSQLVILLFFTSSSALLLLDTTVFETTLHRELRWVYKGQFPCLHPNASGVRSLLKFDLQLNNPSSHELRLGEKPSIGFIITDNNSTVLRTGSIAVACVRDSRCSVEPLISTVCTSSTISGLCNSTIPLSSECTLIDVTGIKTKQVNLLLQLQGNSVDSTIHNISGVEIKSLPIWKKTTTGNTVFTMIFIGVVVLLFSVVPVIVDRKTMVT
jgi:hypothetical protein